jgi:hypothetical protein
MITSRLKKLSKPRPKFTTRFISRAFTRTLAIQKRFCSVRHRKQIGPPLGRSLPLTRKCPRNRNFRGRRLVLAIRSKPRSHRSSFRFSNMKAGQSTRLNATMPHWTTITAQHRQVAAIVRSNFGINSASISRTRKEKKWWKIIMIF